MHKEMFIVVGLGLACWGLLTGCVPLVTGLKQYKEADGSEWNFITGADFTIGANGLDSVDNNRGIEPNKYKK